MLFTIPKGNTLHLKGSDSMCKLFDDWTNEIKKYCDDNNYDFELAKNLSQSWNQNTVVLYHCVPSDTIDGLLNDTPSPMVLLIRREKNGRLTFEKTKNTDKYLRKAS